MKLLALSDVHSNLIAVRKMRAQERNDFDAIVIAGDFGGDAAEGLFSILFAWIAFIACAVVGWLV